MGSAPRTTSLEVVSNVTLLVASVERHVAGFTLFSLDLDVDVGKVVEGEGFAFGGAESGFTFLANLLEAVTKLFAGLGFIFVMQLGKESVVLLIGVQLEGVLVQGEEGVVAVSKISEGTALNSKVIKRNKDLPSTSCSQ